MRRRTTLGDRNLVGGNIIRIRAEKKMLLRIEAYILQLLIIHPILLLVKLIILLPRLTLMDMKRFILHRL